MADTLGRIAQAAGDAGFMIRWEDDDRLVIAPEFHGELKVNNVFHAFERQHVILDFKLAY